MVGELLVSMAWMPFTTCRRREAGTLLQAVSRAGARRLEPLCGRKLASLCLRAACMLHSARPPDQQLEGEEAGQGEGAGDVGQ